MGIFDKLFSKTKKKEVTKEENEDPFKDAPVFKQMMNDFEKNQNEFLKMFEKIIPILKPGKEPSKKVIINGIEHKLPYDSLPVISPINFDAFHIVFGIDKGTHFEWLQNKHIKNVKNDIKTQDITNKAYENLIKETKGKISIDMISENIGMLINCNSFESSFITIDELWENIRRKLNTDEVIYGIPTQDVFIFTRKDKIADIELLKEKVKELYGNPNYQKKLSNKLYFKKKDFTTEIYNQ